MPVDGVASYVLRGDHPAVEGNSLEEALAAMVQYWETRRPLAVHDMGNLVLSMSIGGTSIEFEITDPDLLDLLRGPGGPGALVAALSAQPGWEPGEVERLFSEAYTTARVDVLRVPGDPFAWGPGPSLDPATVLPAGVSVLAGAWIHEEDRARARGDRRRRSGTGEALVRSLARAGQAQGLSWTEMARRSGVPRSTLRDAAQRMAREETRPPQVVVHVTGRRLSREDRQVLAGLLRRRSAAAVARDTGIPERTLRDVRARQAEGRDAGTRRTYTEVDREALRARVRAGERPTLAGAALGIPGRTARQWAQDLTRGPRTKGR